MNKAKHNLVYLLMSQIVTWSVTVLGLIVVPRYLGPDSFGELGFATTFTQFFMLAASLGTGMYLTREVAREDSIIGHYVYNALVQKFVLGIVVSVVAVLTAMALGASGTKLVLVTFACVATFLTITNDVFVGALAGLERMGRPAMWATVQICVATIGGVLILLIGGGVVLFALFIALAGLIPLIANAKVVWPWTGGSRSIDFGVWKKLVRGGFPLMILGALVAVYGTIDIPILSAFAGDTAVAWYVLAYRFVGIPIFIATTTMTAMFPSMSARGVTIDGNFTGLVNRSLRLVALVSVPASAAIAVLAERIIDLLYDDRYSEAVPIIRILSISIPLTTLGVALGTALIASDRQRRYVLLAIIAAIFNPVACLFMIPWAVDRYDNGAIGAAIVTVGTELVIIAGLLLFSAPGVMNKATTWFCVRTVLSAGVMAAVLAIFGDLPLALLCALGVGVYGLVSIAVRTLAIEDVRGFSGVFGGALRSARNGAA